MASITQDEIYKTFAAVSGKDSSKLDGMTNSLADVAAPIGKIGTNKTSATQTQKSAPAVAGKSTASTMESIISTVLKGTTALGTAVGTGTSAGAGKSIASTVGSIASTVLKGGFGVVPLVSELLGLFGGGGSAPPPALVKYAMPAALNFEAAGSGSGLSNADSDQWGMPRSYGAGAAGGGSAAGGGAAGGGEGSNGNGSNGNGNNGTGAKPAPQITVNVQAMDARSFLDRSTDIAAAVREAMLNLNSINDVVNDL